MQGVCLRGRVGARPPVCLSGAVPDVLLLEALQAALLEALLEALPAALPAALLAALPAALQAALNSTAKQG